MVKAERDLPALEARLGHRFANKELLAQALMHVSAIRQGEGRIGSYQRLEFLGDRVLGLAIAEMLLATYPDAEEGELARRMALLVRGETCADVAREWELGPNIRLGAGEAQTGGRRRQTILADACEAVIGAVFLDGGFGPAKALVARSWGERLKEPLGDRRDAKTKLQEIAQSRQLSVPVYTEVSRTGPAHRMTFVIVASVEGLGEAEGQGHSKREAEQVAARAFLDKLESEA
jgi:ribonuclease III